MYILGVPIFVMKFGWIFTLGTIIQPPNVDPNEDANNIFLATDRDAELMRILPQRRWSHRIAIAEEYKKIDPKNPLIPDGYIPLRGDSFRDLVFVMTTNHNDALLAFILAALRSTTPKIFANAVAKIFIELDKNKKFIMNAKNGSVEDFEKSVHKAVFTSTITSNNKKFLQNLIQRNREWEPPTWRNDAYEMSRIFYMTNMLVRESQGWERNRMMLDYILMNKSMVFGRQVIMEFNRVNPGGEDILTAIDKHIVDNNVKLGYKYLVKYVLNGPLFLIDLIHGNKNEPYDQHAIEIIYITTTSEITLHELDIFFVQKYDQCISEYLLSKNNTDPVNQMLAVMAKGDDCRSSKIDAAGEGDVLGARKWDL